MSKQNDTILLMSMKGAQFDRKGILRDADCKMYDTM